MALNINFSGYVYDRSGTIGNSNIWYRVYFRKINGSSSTSKWDTYETAEGSIRQCEGTGYWAFNLGDGGMLTQDGSAGSSDRVVVTFFQDENDSNNDDKDSCTLTEIGAYEWVLTSSTNYAKNMQTVSTDETINSDCKPDLAQWRLNGRVPGGSSNGLVFSNYYYTSSSCAVTLEDTYTTANGGTMYHWWQRSGVTINNGFRIILREYDFHNGSGWQTLGSTGNIQWSTPGYKKCLLKLTTCFGNTNESVRDTDDIEMVIYWRAPVPNIDCNEDNTFNHILVPDTAVTFDYNGSDPDNQIDSIDWTINDPGFNTISTGHDKGDTVAHSNGPGTSWFGHAATPGAFGVSGTHNVEISINWDNGIDGTSTPAITYDENFIQDLFSGPTCDFTQSPPAAKTGLPVDTTNTSTNVGRVGTAGVGELYDWKWDDNGSVTITYNQNYVYVFTNTPDTSNVEVTLYAHWNDGFTDHVAEVSKAITFTAQVEIKQGDIPDATCVYSFNISGTSTGGGNPTGYKWEVIYDPYVTNELIWSSPTSLDQQGKPFQFAEAGRYDVIGYIFGAGSPTDATASIVIDEVCIPCDDPVGPVTPGEDTVSGFIRKEEEPKPIIRVTNIQMSEKKKKKSEDTITVKSIKITD